MSLIVRTRLEPLSAKRLKFTLELVDDDTPWQRDSVECLRRALLKLPCATLYPELTAKAIKIFAKWRARFPDHVWHRFTKVPQTAAFGAPRVCKEFNESCPVLEDVLEWLRGCENACPLPDCDASALWRAGHSQRAVARPQSARFDATSALWRDHASLW